MRRSCAIDIPALPPHFLDDFEDTWRGLGDDSLVSRDIELRPFPSPAPSPSSSWRSMPMTASAVPVALAVAMESAKRHQYHKNIPVFAARVVERTK